MRVILPGIALFACGPVHLGDERAQQIDAAIDDAALEAHVEVAITLRPQGTCGGCFEARAQGTGGRPPYVYEWEDGSREATRVVCPSQGRMRLSVTARDADKVSSAAHTTELEVEDAGCPVPPLLCLNNLSLEGTPAVNTGAADAFDLEHWLTCTDPPSQLPVNTPEVLNATLERDPWVLPDPTDGSTYLGMAEGEQVSQPLCEPLQPGSQFFLKLDLARLYVGANVVPDTERPFLEIWGGLAADCSARQLLWASPLLGLEFQTFCAELKPDQYLDNLVLRARSDNSLPSISYLLVDNLVPVTSCP